MPAEGCLVRQRSRNFIVLFDVRSFDIQNFEVRELEILPTFCDRTFFSRPESPLEDEPGQDEDVLSIGLDPDELDFEEEDQLPVPEPELVNPEPVQQVQVSFHILNRIEQS